MAIARDEWEIAQVVCTDKQLEALELYRQGSGYKSIGRQLRISPDAARGRIEAAMLRIANVKRRIGV